MDSFNPTTKTQAALTAALQAASAAGNPEIRPAHLLMALRRLLSDRMWDKFVGGSFPQPGKTA